MKVYIVFENNGEVYEDYQEWAVKEFASKKDAQKYVYNARRKEKRHKHDRPFELHQFWLEEIEKINLLPGIRTY